MLYIVYYIAILYIIHIMLYTVHYILVLYIIIYYIVFLLYFSCLAFWVTLRSSPFLTICNPEMSPTRHRKRERKEEMRGRKINKFSQLEGAERPENPNPTRGQHGPKSPCRLSLEKQINHPAMSPAKCP